MGALYEDVETFFGDIFAWYGKVVSRFPILLTTIPLLFCVFSGFGLLSIRYETNIENLYSPINSEAQKDRQLMKSHFKPGQLPEQVLKKKNLSRQLNLFDFKFNQQINYPAYFEIIIYSKFRDKTFEFAYLPENLQRNQLTSNESKTPSNRTTALLEISSNPSIVAFYTKTVASASISNFTTSQLFNLTNTKINTLPFSNFKLISFDANLADDLEENREMNTNYNNLTNLDSISMDAIQQLYHYIATFKSHKTRNYSYENICASFLNQCLVDIIELTDDNRKTSCIPKRFVDFEEKINLEDEMYKIDKHDFLASNTSRNQTYRLPTKPKITQNYVTSIPFVTTEPQQTVKNKTAQQKATGFKASKKASHLKSHFSILPPLSISTKTRVLKIRFNLRSETYGQARQNQLKWQEAILDQMKLFKSRFIDVAFVASDSLEIELRDHVGGDTKYFSLSVVAMMITATLAGSGGSLDHVVLAYTGVVAALLAILGAFGLLSLFGTSFVNLCSVMPFLVLGIGVDDMLQLLIEWRKVSASSTQDERLSNTLRSAAVSITITSLTDLLAFCIGATSPFLSVRNFCACSGLGIFLCYMNQLTFFSGCIVLISRRSKCCQRKKKQIPQESLCLGNSVKRSNDTTTSTIVDIDNDMDESATAETELLNKTEDDFRIVNEPTDSRMMIITSASNDCEQNVKDNIPAAHNNPVILSKSTESNNENQNTPTNEYQITILPSTPNMDCRAQNDEVQLAAPSESVCTMITSSTSSTPLIAKPSSHSHAENKPIHRNTSGLFTALLTNVLTNVPSVEHPTSNAKDYPHQLIADDKVLNDSLKQKIPGGTYDNCFKCCGLTSCYERFPLSKQLNSCDRKSFSAPAVGICETFSKYFSKYYPKILLHWAGKTTTVIIFVAYVCMSIYGVTRLEEGLNLEALVPSEHYYRHHAVIDYKFFPNCGIVVTFVIHQPITYHEVRTQEKVHSFLKSVEASDFVVDNSSVSWLEAYNHSLMSKDKPKRKAWNASEFGKKLQTEFLPKNFQYLADVKFSKHAKSPWVIEASRFYVVCHRTNTSEDEKDLMLEMRKLASNSSLPMKAFSPNFVFYEHYASIVKNTLLPVGVTVIGMLFVALVFIPHPIAVTCVIGSMASVVVGMMGFMQLCSLALSAITTMQIILGVGICVSFTVRTSHAFMTATGKSRNERVTSALVKVGASILTGASCSSLSAFALYYGSSFIFASFFKTMAFALFLGVLHSIVFLPVMLSFVGPRRTGKPRLFIPTTAPSSTPSADSNVDSKEKNYPSCTSKEKLERKLSQESTTSKNSFNTQTVKPLKSSLSNLPRVSSKSLLFSNSKDDKISAESANSNDEEACTKNAKQHKVSFKLEDSLKPQTVQSSELSHCEKNCD